MNHTLKPAAQRNIQLPTTGIGYSPPSLDPFDRKTDIDAALLVETGQGGIAGIADWDLGPVTLTSIGAWRWWEWDAANDRDYTRLSIQTVQHIPSRQIQYSQELRVASNGMQTVDYVAGLYWFEQRIKGRLRNTAPLRHIGCWVLLLPLPAICSTAMSRQTTQFLIGWYELR